MPWRKAMVKAMQDSGEPMRYEIAQAIIDKGYRVNVDATPAATVIASRFEHQRYPTRSVTTI
jgi:hypothetical protein